MIDKVMRTIWLLSFLWLILVGHVSAADPNEFIDFSAEDLPGRLYVPPEATDGARPLIVFLHGAGETGTDNRAQVNGNINNLLTAAKTRGAFLYAPQATTVRGQIFNWSPSERTDQVMQMVDRILLEQNADETRVYLTGLSMGGGGTFTMGSRYSERIAAAVPIAGVRAADDFSAAQMVDVPTWAFHARNDNVVSRNNTVNNVNEMLIAAGESPLEFPPRNDRSTVFEFVDQSDAIDLRVTEWPTGGHGIWGRVYGTEEVYDWMFQHQVPEPKSATLILLGLVTILLRRR